MDLFSKGNGIQTSDTLCFRDLKVLSITFVLASLCCVSCAPFKDQSFSSQEMYLFDKYHPNKVISNGVQDKVVATFYGTSSLLISDSKEAILIDGFFSRPEFPNFLFSNLEQINESDIKAIIDPSLISKDTVSQIVPLQKVIVVHSHYDHAMDAPCIANAYGATLIGSQSTLNIKCRDISINHESLIENLGPNKPHQELKEHDQFKITMIHSNHASYGSKLVEALLGIGKEIKQPLTMPAYITQLSEGQSYSVLLEHKMTKLRILIHGSAGYKTSAIANAVGDKPIDWLFLSVGGLDRTEKKQPGFAKQFLTETIDASKAKYVVPIHWDDFTRKVTTSLHPPKPRFGNFFKEIKLVEQHLDSKKKSQQSKLVLLNFNQKVTMSKENLTKKPM
ncbi:MBL fold metallo-hydrolase [Paraglaciecola aquimarina]|uniref:MBL fold metallo-hydrolase n=1 Tax=Paraglaciecola algarum TaxID=3050085 RepID=A0ABS9D6C6_9ALTE|nr:MBL fold metallo-hydrolase [Paraglaciecola sp. G1-23]MCF2948483.1 MBL fold metallo-hydrolase [Paraglaciecola sp. G1-23]